MPRIFLLDNIDSFTYNLQHQLWRLGAEVLVLRAGDSVSTLLTQVQRYDPTHLVLSPGPQRPEDHPANAAILQAYVGQRPILGVCLGMQAINVFCGGTLRRDPRPLHGKVSAIRHAGEGLFTGLPPQVTMARYHSLLVDQLGADLDVMARTTETAQIMALQHRRWPLYGVQFHPESFLSEGGDQLVQNFLALPMGHGELPVRGLD